MQKRPEAWTGRWLGWHLPATVGLCKSWSAMLSYSVLERDDATGLGTIGIILTTSGCIIGSDDKHFHGTIENVCDMTSTRRSVFDYI